MEENRCPKETGKKKGVRNKNIQESFQEMSFEDRVNTIMCSVEQTTTGRGNEEVITVNGNDVG